MAKAKSGRPSTGLRWGEGQVREFVRADGSLRVQVRWWETLPDGDRKLRTKSFTSADHDRARDQAEDFARQNRRDRRDGRFESPADMTVRDVLLAYIERGKSRWKPSTYATYRYRAFHQLIPDLGEIRVMDLTTARIQHWIDGVNAIGKQRKTLDEAVRLLSGALKEATQLGILRQNEARGVRLPTVQPTEHRTWDAGQIAAVLDAVKDDPMWHALYRVALFTGIRPGGSRALQWPDIDLDSAVLHVRRTITRDEQYREQVGTTTKTGRARAVALPQSAVTALRTWKVRQAELQLQAELWDDRRFVFTGRSGKYLGGTSWQSYQEQTATRAGVPNIGLHELRHTNATIELAAGTHPKIVSDRLGHRKIETTLNLYSHVSPDLQRSAADALEARIEAAKPEKKSV